jgi:RimJ/RimL family protein N-acetyltransferase
VNTECKFLLLRHAFEDLGCIRVQIKTDLRNERSQRAIERIGAVKEGILRDHMLLPDGTVRSSVYYSILAREWPAVKQRLTGMLEK